MRLSSTAMLLLLAALLLGAGCTSTQDLATYQRHGLSFDYPAGWNLSEERYSDGGYVLTLNTGEGSSLTISTTPNLSAQFPATERLNTLGVWYLGSRVAMINVNATVIEEREEAVAGRPAKRIDYTISNDGVLYRSSLVVTAIDDTGYSFNLWAPPGAYDSLADDFQAVLASFRTDGPR